MKKNLFLLTALCLAIFTLPSCSNDEDIPTPDIPEEPETNGSVPWFKETDHNMGQVKYCTGVKVRTDYHPGGVDSEGYTWTHQDLNYKCGGDYVYIGMKFEPWDPKNKKKFITDIIAYAIKEGESEPIDDPNWRKVINGRTYQLDHNHASLNSSIKNCGYNIFLIYTTDNRDDKYVVNHSFDGYGDPWTTWPTVPYGYDCTRVVCHYDGKGYGHDMFHLGTNDCFMDMYHGNTYIGVAEANYGHDAKYRMYPVLCRLPEPKDWESDLENWMKYLPDSIPITELCLAGSHDTWTNNIGVPSSARCQEWEMSEQFRLGARVFDLRAGMDLRIIHGPAKTPYYAKEEMKRLDKLLTDHPKEFVFLNVQFESNWIYTSPTEGWKKSMDKCLKEDLGAGRAIVYRDGLKLGDVRGKVLIFQNIDPIDSHHRGGDVAQRAKGYPSGWSEFYTSGDDKTYKFYCQNNYKPGGYGKKMDSIKSFYSSYENGNLYKNYVGINYISSAIGDGSLVNATAVTAAHTNPDVWEYFNNYGRKVHTGYCHMDYYGTNFARQCSPYESHKVYGLALAHKIIEQNFK